MPSDYFVETPRSGQLAKFSEEVLVKFAPDPHLNAFGIRQQLPVGLDYVANSAQPPAAVETQEGRTLLTWAWSEDQATGTHTVTYGVAPVEPGVFTIQGDVTLQDKAHRDTVWPLPTEVITATGPCGPTPTVAATPSVTRPPSPSPTYETTPSPVASATATESQPTPADGLGPVYLPRVIRTD